MEVEGKNTVPSVIAAAHELKSPLSLIRQLSLMLDGQALSSEDLKKVSQRIQLTTERALRLTSDLTKAYNLNLNDPTIFPLSPISPHQVCQDLLYDMSPYIKSKNREIKLVGAGRTPLVIANADLLSRILANFMDNALNYTFGDEKVQLIIKVKKKEKKVRLGLRDYGPAIKPSYFEDIKKGLATNAESIHARPLSSGLGIYISAQFAQMIGSKIGVTRHKDGATFYVDVPISTQLKLFDF